MTDNTVVGPFANRDTVRVNAGTFTDPVTGNNRAQLAVAFPVNPAMQRTGVTALTGVAVNYIRFRILMSQGDYANAGASNGFSGYFIYPAMDYNYNR